MAGSRSQHELTVEIAGKIASSFGSAIGNVNKHMATLGKVAGGAAKLTAAGMAAAGTAIAGVVAASTNVGKEFEAQMSTVGAIAGNVANEDLAAVVNAANEMGLAFKEGSNATETSMNILEAKAKQMGATTQFSASEAGQAMEYMAMAGWKGADMIQGIEGIMNLAAASGEDLASTSDIVTDALTAFGMTASDSGQFADVLAAASSNANTNVAMLGESFKYVAPLAGTLGYSAEDASIALGLMANAGIKSTQAGTALRTIMNNLAGEIKICGASLGETTIATTNADGSMRDALSLLDQCIAFHLGSELTYDNVLDVLGAVDTEVFSRLLRSVLNRDVPGCVGLLGEVVVQGRELVQFVTDFTWYLRNLMLVQVADNLEDVIDMSAENLNRLKEEAGMVDMDRIVRYIRIFSELSGQIRYSVQKRILVEVALIKLCRPQMETEQDAVLDRIRQVEEQLEKGVVAVRTESATASGASAVVKKEKPKLSRAIPEEVRQVVAKWPAVVGNAENPMRAYLKSARLSLSEEGNLLMVLEDGVASDYFTQHPENKSRLEELLADFSGKEIPVVVQTVREQERFEENYVDISKVIQMDIEEEE